MVEYLAVDSSYVYRDGLMLRKSECRVEAGEESREEIWLRKAVEEG